MNREDKEQQGKISGSRRNIQGFILIYSWFKKKSTFNVSLRKIPLPGKGGGGWGWGAGKRDSDSERWTQKAEERRQDRKEGKISQSEKEEEEKEGREKEIERETDRQRQIEGEEILKGRKHRDISVGSGGEAGDVVGVVVVVGGCLWATIPRVQSMGGMIMYFRSVVNPFDWWSATGNERCLTV